MGTSQGDASTPDGTRVAIDVTPLLGPPTGIHEATAAMVQALTARPDVTLSGYVLSAQAPSPRVQALARSLGMDANRSRVPARLCLAGWARMDRPALRRVVGDCDIVHGTNYTAPPGTSRLITVQDLSPVTHPQWCSPAVRRVGPALRRSVERGAHLHVTTAAAAREAVEVLGAERSRVHVVPAGLRPVAAGDAAAARRLVGAQRFVLTLGTTEPRKGLVALPRAVAGLPADIKLVVAGPPGSDEAALRAAVERCGLAGRFVRLTGVDEQLKADLLHGASVLAYPSLLEGFGLPPLEAVAVGTPVAATAVGALSELLEPEVSLAPAGDEGAFAERLEEAITDPRPYEPSVQARIAELSWDRAADRLAEVYRRIIA